MEKLPIEVLESAIDTQKRFIPLYEKKFGGNPTFDISLLLLLEELKHYRELQEQGRLPVIPCKVGDIFYVIRGKGEDTKITKESVERIIFKRDCIIIHTLYENRHNRYWKDTELDYFKQIAFGKKELAEQALAERQV